jgi:HPt (histidine-containing phosphotransfer) domain-containing protein
MNPAPPNESIAQLIDALGVEDTRDLVRTYIQEYNGLIRTMASADRESQHRATHSLKSSSRHMGLVSLVRRLEALEARLFLPNGKVNSNDIEAISVEFDRAVLPLRKFADGK